MEGTALNFRPLLCFCLMILNPLLASSSKQPPNIILVVADDLGYNDVGFHGSEIFTPNLDKLAKTGVILENYYTSPSCTPSRSQLLTGRYGIHTGQIYNIDPMEPSCLSLDEVTFAEKLKERNYRTHMIGKWHLGHCAYECTPTHRGFDSFLGILLGSGDHFQHFKRSKVNGVSHFGYDIWRNNTYAWRLSGIYSTTMYRNHALRTIATHDPKYPLFMYLSFQAPHSPMQVPREWLERNSGIKNVQRRYVAGMVTALDAAVGELVTSLKSRGLWENTVLVFTTDNGGQIKNGASNWPLRGGKGSFWEGGVRAVGFVNSPLIKQPGRTTRRLMHISDWFPTFVHLSGGDLNGTKPLDGVNQWEAISRNAASPRKELLLGIATTADMTLDKRRISKECRPYIPKVLRQCGKSNDPKRCMAKKGDPCLTYKGSRWCGRSAIRRGKWKLLVGTQKPGNWIQPRGSEKQTYCSSSYENGKRLLLFNVRRDPSETTDLSQSYPKKVAKLMAKLEEYRRHSVGETKVPEDIMGAPMNNGGVWGPWLSQKVKTLA
jgi:arylsulfatase A-like enzyme